MTSPKVKIIEFYAQEKYEPPKAGVPYKPQKFYVDVKMEKVVTIDDMADNIVQRLKTATKREGIQTKRITCSTKFSFVDYIIEKSMIITRKAEDTPKEWSSAYQETLLYIAGDILPSNYYRIEGYPSYEPVRILTDNLRKEGIKESQKELKPEAPVKSAKQGEEEGKDNSKDLNDRKKRKKKKE